MCQLSWNIVEILLPIAIDGLVKIVAHKHRHSITSCSWSKHIFRAFPKSSRLRTLLAIWGVSHVMLLTNFWICALTVSRLCCCLNLIREATCGTTHSTNTHSILIHTILGSDVVPTPMGWGRMLWPFWLLWIHPIFDSTDTAKGARQCIWRNLWKSICASALLLLQNWVVLGIRYLDAIIATLMALGSIGEMDLLVLLLSTISKIHVRADCLLISCVVPDSVFSRGSLVYNLRGCFWRFALETNHVELRIWEI